MIKLKALKIEMLSKKKFLDAATIQLKKEFVGIDEVIDEIMESLSSWYFFPDMQTKPLIINLWGLTGVGKSSLVNRISELIAFSNKYFRFDLGDKGNQDWAISSKLNELSKRDETLQLIIALDEFQHARTKNEMGMEKSKDENRVIWDILDSGKLSITRYTPRLDDISRFLLNLKRLVSMGVQAEKGLVVNRKLYFLQQLDLMDDYEKYSDAEIEELEIPLVAKYHHYFIYVASGSKFRDIIHLKEELLKLDAHETIELIETVIDIALSPKIIDCSKSVIFVMGNLDGAYNMSDNFNPDMSADEFHQQSKGITISKIKNSLKDLFRSEQIARLGNNHVIYPAFSSKSFREIIKLELTKIKKNVFDMNKVEIDFEESVVDFIYNEGVYPTQGTRPVFTTIHQTINSKLAKIIGHGILKIKGYNQLFFEVKNSKLLVSYLKNKKLVHVLENELSQNLTKLRSSRKDEMQSIIAVHESGHALTSILLMHTLPEIICSVVADEDTGGFMYSKHNWKYIAKREIVNRLAMMLGGLASEKVIFGEENVTSGSKSDLSKATQFVTELLKECGLGTIIGSIEVKDFRTNTSIYDIDDEINSEARALLNQGLDLAIETIKKNMKLLLLMADHLSDNQYIKKEQLIGLLKENGFTELLFTIENTPYKNFYRNKLKLMAKDTIGNKNEQLDLLALPGFSLNHGGKK